MPRRKHLTRVAARKARPALSASVNKKGPLIKASTEAEPIPSASAPPPVVIINIPQPLLTEDSLDNCDILPVHLAGSAPEPESAPASAPLSPQMVCPKIDTVAFMPFPPAQITLEEACWALNPMTVLLVLANGRQGLHLGGLAHRDGNSPLQMAVDGLIYQLDYLRHHHLDYTSYREQCRRNFMTIMRALVRHMTLPELQNWNYYQESNAVGKLAFYAFDWRTLQYLTEAMNRLSADGSEEPMFRYTAGKSCEGYEEGLFPWENDPHVVGCLREKFWDPLNQHYGEQVHPCGNFVR